MVGRRFRVALRSSPADRVGRSTREIGLSNTGKPLEIVGDSRIIETMFDSVDLAGAAAAVAQLQAAVDELITVGLASLTGEAVLAVTRAVEAQKRRLATADHALIAEIESRGSAREHGCRDTTTLLSQLLRITRVRPRIGCVPRRTWVRGVG